jgi:hexosaminidase
MVADWHEGFVLRGEVLAGEAGDGPYRLVLANQTDAPLRGFRLGLSGPLRISDDAQPRGARIVQQLANYAELAPPADFVLAPGAAWTIDIDRLDFPLRHWTDGAVTGFVIHADGTTEVALTVPTARAGSAPYRRGTMPLAGTPSAISVVPWPNEVEVGGSRSAPDGLAVTPGEGAGAAAAFAELTDILFPGEGLSRAAHEGGLPVTLARNAGLAPEAYRLDFSAAGARVEAAGDTGFLYGLVTLAQMARGARRRRQDHLFPAEGHIADAPQAGFRGCHLDVARRFYAVGEVRRFLAILAWNKLNRFHWHLSDDEAWRVEIAAFPALTARGAWRGYGLELPPLLGSGPEPSGGYYSKADIAGIVALAERLGIAVIPEIDMPGHCYALLSVLPQLRDPGENAPYRSIQAFPSNCLNPANPAVHGVVETIFGEMVEMFPARWFHVGADEVPSDAWQTSPLANAMRRELGVSGASALQARFLGRLQAFLSTKGKVTGAWEEAAHGGGIAREACYLVGWVDVEGSQRLAGAGYDVVVAPGQAYYLDMANGPEWHEPGAGWAGWSSPEKTYRFDPTAGWSAAERAHFLGVQGCIWSEPMTERAVFDRLVFPRLSAIAETGWTRPEAKDFGRFAGLVGLMPNLYGAREGAGEGL